MAAIAIECHRNAEELREFSRRLYQSQDEERRRIARELHDSTGQKLAVLQLNLSMIRNTITSPPPGFDEILLESVSLAGSVSDELRTLSYLLHPPMLDERGLNTAILWYVSGINQRDGLRVEVEITQDLRRLSEEAELAIFRVVQASLANIHLHSGASSAKIKIEQNLDGVVVTVSDDGHGIPDGVLDHSSRTKTMGVGITGMRERVEQLGGGLEIETSRRKGTRVKATVPKRHFRNIA
jgi:two-component system, NarL family, sensor kinase